VPSIWPRINANDTAVSSFCVIRAIRGCSCRVSLLENLRRTSRHAQ
jgi:hypothetical protein